MVKVPIESFDACDDFIVLVVECLIVAAAMKMLGMSEMHEIPTTNYAPKGTDTWMEPECERGKVLNHIIDDFMKTFFSFTYNSSASDPQSSSSRQDDRIYLYAKQALSFGLFYLEFRDAIKEGDGDRVLRCYRYMLPIFQNSGRKNYANETLNFLLNYDYILSKRQDSLTYMVVLGKTFPMIFIVSTRYVFVNQLLRALVQTRHPSAFSE